MEANIPFFSVIIPTYNASNYIRKTLDSVKHQTFDDFEVIVIDDSSTDDTSLIISNYCKNDNRFRLITLKDNMGGPAGPRNIGVNNANGEWVAFLDADDIWHPRKLKIQKKYISGKSHISFCCSDIVKFVDSYNDELVIVDNVINYSVITLSNQLKKSRIANSSVIIKKAIVEKYPFNESINYKAVEDFDCWLRVLVEVGECHKIRLPLIGYRLQPDQISRNKIEMAKKFLMVLNNFKFISGKRLGFKKYLYFATYIFLSLISIIKNKFKIRRQFG